MTIGGKLLGNAIKTGIELVFTGIALLVCKAICKSAEVYDMEELGDKIVGESKAVEVNEKNPIGFQVNRESC